MRTFATASQSSQDQPPINLFALLCKLGVIDDFAAALNPRADAFDNIRTYTNIYDYDAPVTRNSDIYMDEPDPDREARNSLLTFLLNLEAISEMAWWSATW